MRNETEGRGAVVYFLKENDRNENRQSVDRASQSFFPIFLMFRQRVQCKTKQLVVHGLFVYTNCFLLRTGGIKCKYLVVNTPKLFVFTRKYEINFL